MRFPNSGPPPTERDTAIFSQVAAQADRLRSTNVLSPRNSTWPPTELQSDPEKPLTALVTALATQPCATPLTGHTNIVKAVAFSPDGHTLASGSNDHTVRLWNVTDHGPPHTPGPTLTGHTDYVNAVAFSPDGRTLATGSGDQTVRLWNVTDPATPHPWPPLTGHTSWVFAVAFSPDGHTLATGSLDTTVRLWDVTDPPTPHPWANP